jgi:Lrp/AsnC family transcriptional regulator, leucine-responsive regulatory protein
MRSSDSLDSVDRQILDRLKLNGREPAASIAKAVSLSAPAVQRRIDRLEKRGIIRGYTAAINYDRIEASVDAYIELSFDGKTDVDEALGRLIVWAEVREAIMLAGEPDALLRVRLRSTSELGRLAMQLRSQHDIISTKTHVVVGRWWHGAVEGGQRARQ